ncbi:MAG: response regulator [Rhodocyclaceae bacterium]|nr:response regulator [Rhodocyclaceae bacterium]MDZ4216042.1 response regulator [Rhodocyclaceae bacterium]
MKMIIVDDNESLRKVLRALCESEGHTVIAEYADGHGLLDFIKENSPDVVCLDYELPGENGLELLVHMDAAANQVDVVMITGSDDPELKGHAADLGATGFIQKPFEQSQVIDELNAIAQTRAIAARAAVTPSALSKPAAPDPTPPAGVTPGSAVIIDDSGSIRLLLKGIFEEIGIKVVGFAANGKEGIEVVEKTHPAVVCLDVDMPVMTGLEALPRIRAASPQSRVVMITGNAGRPIVEAAVAGGAKGYFLKPIRPLKVEEFMRKLLQR